MSRSVVPDEEKNAHDDVLSDRDDIRTGDLQNLDAVFNSGIEINMVGSYTSSDTELEVLCLLNQIAGEIPGMEGGGDEDLSIHDMLLEVTIGAFLTGRNNELMTQGLDPGFDAKLILNSSEQAGLFPGSLSTFVENSKNLHNVFEK